MENPGYLIHAFAFFAFLLLSAFLLLGSGRGRRLRFPPGPRGLPFVGHLHLLGLNPHRSLCDLSKRHGSLMFLRFGSVPVVVASSPAIARLILQAHDQIFAWRPQPAVPMLLLGCKDILYSQPGPYWKLVRQLCASDLFGSKRLQAFRPLIAEEIHGLLRAISDSAQQESPVPVRAMLYAASANIISRMALGKPLQELSPRSQAGDTPSCSLVALIVEAIELAGVFNPGDFIPWLAWMDLQGCVQRSKSLKPKLDRVWQEIIDNRRSMRPKMSDGQPLDFLDVLLERADFHITDSHIMAILTDVFGAGIDTSSITVEWALCELLANPLVMKKLQEEIIKVVGDSRLVCESDVQNLPYLRATVKETMRLHPVVPLLVPHMASQQCNILDFNIPLHTVAYINVWAIGRDPQTWDNALVFSPERFLDSNLDVRGKDFELLPFGSGRRACPGMALGLHNVSIMLASLLQAFNWTTMKKPNMSEKFGVVMTPEEPLVAKTILRIRRELLEETIIGA
ncbi:hypothetical protein GOP47_0017743 [Adiantum capillus-veneris]|uniref:Cytochrome P450 n=1 Tax=Adiantum capillus-veneris TaxID=13818 RepID=A0A9D4UG79_ADICA|nr:hypothetical protein GOP47_0017743 [Adiantum capillus-veneris]